MNIEIANRLVNLRKEKGLSQEQLAEKIGVSRQAVSKWERSEASPDTDNLIMLARLYEVSLDELLRTEDEIPLPEADAEDGGGEAVEEAEAAETEEAEEENPAPKEKPRDKIRIGADGVHFLGKNGDTLTLGKGGLHFSGDDPQIAEKDLLLQEKIRRDCTIVAVAGLFLCGAAAFFSVTIRSGGALLISLAPIPLLMAYLGKERKAVRVLFTLAMIASSVYVIGTTGYRLMQTFGWLCFLLIPMYYRFIAVLRLRSERKKQGSPKPPPSAYPFCDFLTYHEKAVDLAVYALVWAVTALLTLGDYGWRGTASVLVCLCLIPVGQSLVRAIRERNPDQFSLEALLLFILLSVSGDVLDPMQNFPILFLAALYHWLCRRFMKRFAVSTEAEKSETETE